MSTALKSPLAFIVVSAILGALLFCLLSVINKIQMNVSLALFKGYIAPGVVGAVSGGIIGRALFRINSLNRKLQNRLEVLGKFIVLCSNCKKIKKPGVHTILDAEAWIPFEQFLEEKTHTAVSHGLCPTCIKDLFPEEYEKFDQARSATSCST